MKVCCYNYSNNFSLTLLLLFVIIKFIAFALYISIGVLFVCSREALLTHHLAILPKKSERFVVVKILTKFAFFFILFYYFISIFILLTCRKAAKAQIHRVSNYPDLLPEMPRYCCPLEI